MANEIIVPILGRGLHFGEISNYEKLKNKWFEQMEFDDKNFIHKAFIVDIIYSPDNTYSTTDGHWGTCWLAHILDSGNEDNCYNIYRFRNFMDLIELYNLKGYKFVNE